MILRLSDELPAVSILNFRLAVVLHGGFKVSLPCGGLFIDSPLQFGGYVFQVFEDQGAGLCLPQIAVSLAAQVFLRPLHAASSDGAGTS